MLSQVRVTRGDGFIARRGRYRERDIVLFESGPGAGLRGECRPCADRRLPPAASRLLGFAGGPDRGIKRYHLVAADSLVNGEGLEITLDPAALVPWLAEVSDLPLRAVAYAGPHRPPQRRKAAAWRAASSPGRRYGIVCRRQGMPSARLPVPPVVRAISDAVDDELPSDIGHLLSRKTFAGSPARRSHWFRRPGRGEGPLQSPSKRPWEALRWLAKFLASFYTITLRRDAMNHHGGSVRCVEHGNIAGVVRCAKPSRGRLTVPPKF